MSDLQARGKDAYLISGGFHCLILPVARKLNIKPENIYANKLKFYFTGENISINKFIIFFKLLHI